MSKETTDSTALVVDAAGLEERLGQELTLTDWRAVVAVVVAEPGLKDSAAAARDSVLRAHRVTGAEVIIYETQRSDAGRTQLSSINRARDSLLKDKRILWMYASSAADVRFLRKTAPDLLSAIDLFVELRGEQSSDWPSCRKQLIDLMKSRHSTLDFTGLLPSSVEQRQLPLAELYQPLVDLESDPALLSQGPPPRRLSGLMVLGHPGTGKTTFARHLAWTYARGHADPLGLGAKVPLLVSLSDYGYEREHERVGTLVDFLPKWLEAQGVSGSSSVREHLPDILLLLDGLDEIRAPQARKAVLTEVGRLVREQRVGGVVVTGRSFLVDERPAGEDGLPIISTRAAKHEEIEAFLGAFMRLRGVQESRSKELFYRIKRDADLLALAATPLMAAFMAVLDELEGRLPDRKIEIYYRLGEMLVDRWTRARSIGESRHRRDRVTRADALRVIGPLAWWTVEQGGGAVSETALAREIERIEALRETPQEAARRASALLDLLRRDTALLVPMPGRQWRFVHSSIAEYFAGVQAERDTALWEALLADPFRAEWREIVLFCAGQLGVIEGRVERLDELVSAVLQKSHRAGRYSANYPSLIMGLLAESPGLSQRQIDTLTERVVQFIFTTAFFEKAAWQVQEEFWTWQVRLQDTVADRLAQKLKWWFSDHAFAIRWDRIMSAGIKGTLEDYRAEWGTSAVVVGILALGPFIGMMYSIVQRYDLTLEPTLEQWSTETDWYFQLAQWLVASSREELNRPFGEIARELKLLPS